MNLIFFNDLMDFYTFSYINVSKYDSKYSYLLQFQNNFEDKLSCNYQLFPDNHEFIVKLKYPYFKDYSRNNQSQQHYIINTRNILNKCLCLDICGESIEKDFAFTGNINNVNVFDMKKGINVYSKLIDSIKNLIDFFKNHVYVIKPNDEIEKYDSNKPFCSHHVALLLLDNNIKFGNLLEYVIFNISGQTFYKYINFDFGRLQRHETIEQKINKNALNILNYIKFEYDYYDINDCKDREDREDREDQHEQQTQIFEKFDNLKLQFDQLKIINMNQKEEIERLNKIINRLLN